MPDTCKNCGYSLFDYVELGIKYRKHTVGHMDGIVEIDGKYFVIDYKTTSIKKIEAHKLKGGIFPLKHNVAQITSYCAYIEEEYDIEIHGWILIYLSRDKFLADPFVLEGAITTPEYKKDLLKKLKRDDKDYGKVLKLRKGYDKELWADLIEHKPCKTKAEYIDKMHCYDMCPLAKDGTCFNSVRLKQAIKNLKTKEKRTVI